MLSYRVSKLSSLRLLANFALVASTFSLNSASKEFSAFWGSNRLHKATTYFLSSSSIDPL